MFSENNRISVRQAVRNYGMMVISISALVMPVSMNHTAMPSVLLAVGLLGVYLAGMAAAAAPENRIFQTASYVHGWILVGNSDIVLCHVLLQFVQGIGMPDARGRNFVSAVSPSAGGTCYRHAWRSRSDENSGIYMDTG